MEDSAGSGQQQDMVIVQRETLAAQTMLARGKLMTLLASEPDNSAVAAPCGLPNECIREGFC